MSAYVRQRANFVSHFGTKYRYTTLKPTEADVCCTTESNDVTTSSPACETLPAVCSGPITSHGVVSGPDPVGL